MHKKVEIYLSVHSKVPSMFTVYMNLQNFSTFSPEDGAEAKSGS